MPQIYKTHQCREEEGVSDGMPTRVGGCCPGAVEAVLEMGAAGLGLRRGGRGLEGRMSGGGWFRAGRG